MCIKNFTSIKHDKDLNKNINNNNNRKSNF